MRRCCPRKNSDFAIAKIARHSYDARYDYYDNMTGLPSMRRLIASVIGIAGIIAIEASQSAAGGVR
jgi:hypothetical protein